MRPILVAIAGGSTSGKSTLTRRLLGELADRSCAEICLDRYFRNWAALRADEADRLRTANRPDAVLWRAFHDHLRRLLGGEMVQLPAVGTAGAARGEKSWCVGPRDVLIVEGLFALWDDELRRTADLRVFVDTPDDERVLRRITRDVVERGGTIERSVAWYRRDVAPGYHRFTEPTRWHADLVVPNAGFGGLSEPAVHALVSAIRALLDARPAG
ncbi:MAG TPA: uridine kinase [Chloroflexota bacterium]|nr:uridine kinase [Chloroflexota bacterium]